MKQKEILILTSFGPVLFDVVKDYIDPKAIKIKNSKNETSVKEETIPTDLSYYAENFAQKKGWKLKEMDKFLTNLLEISPNAAFQIFLREIAIELDKKYEDHIEKSKEIYCVSLTNGHIFQVDKKFIKNFRNFAAFRTMDDAKLACKITRVLLKNMFKSDRK